MLKFLKKETQEERQKETQEEKEQKDLLIRFILACSNKQFETMKSIIKDHKISNYDYNKGINIYLESYRYYFDSYKSMVNHFEKYIEDDYYEIDSEMFLQNKNIINHFKFILLLKKKDFDKADFIDLNSTSKLIYLIYFNCDNLFKTFIEKNIDEHFFSREFNEIPIDKLTHEIMSGLIKLKNFYQDNLCDLIIKTNYSDIIIEFIETKKLNNKEFTNLILTSKNLTIINKYINDPKLIKNKKELIHISFTNDFEKLFIDLLNEFNIDPSQNFNKYLRDASKFGHLKIVKELLKDPRVNCNDFPIIYASENGNLEIVKELLKDPRTNIYYKKLEAFETKHLIVKKELLNHHSKNYFLNFFNEDIENLITN